MRHPNIACVVSLDGSYAAPALGKTLMENQFFSAAELRAPVLDLRRENSEWDFSALDALSRAPIFLAQIKSMEHMSFTNDALISGTWHGDRQDTEPAVQKHLVIRENILGFLQAVFGPQDLTTFEHLFSRQFSSDRFVVRHARSQ